MKFFTHKGIEASEVEQIVPPKLGGYFKGAKLPVGNFDLVVFTSQKTVISSLVRKAFRSIQGSELESVFVGRSFTEDALEMMDVHGVLVVHRSAYLFNDESFIRRST